MKNFVFDSVKEMYDNIFETSRQRYLANIYAYDEESNRVLVFETNKKLRSKIFVDGNNAGHLKFHQQQSENGNGLALYECINLLENLELLMNPNFEPLTLSDCREKLEKGGFLTQVVREIPLPYGFEAKIKRDVHMAYLHSLRDHIAQNLANTSPSEPFNHKTPLHFGLEIDLNKMVASTDDTQGIEETIENSENIIEKEEKKEVKKQSLYMQKYSAMSNDELYDLAKKGEFFVDFKWLQNVEEELIPPIELLDDFIPTSEYFQILRSISETFTRVHNAMLDNPNKPVAEILRNNSNTININVIGEPSTGKTMLMRALAATFRMPVGTTLCSQDTEVSEFTGRTGVVNGELANIETEFLKIFKNGGFILNEEINLALPNVSMAALGQATEYPFIVKEFEATTVTRHPFTIIVNLFNVGTAGSKPLNEAMASRFSKTYILLAPDKSVEQEILAKKCPDTSLEIIRQVPEIVERIKNFLTSDEVLEEEKAMLVSRRNEIAFIQEYETSKNFVEAANRTLLGGIYCSDLQLAKDITKNVIEPFPFKDGNNE